MRVLGIDPGSRVTGWGVVEERGGALRHVANGTIALGPTGALTARLSRLHAECAALLVRFVPEAVALECAFVARNVQSALRLGEARGAVVAAVGATAVPLHEYAPAAVKLATCGHGLADKGAVARGIALRLALAEPLAVDAADALALALCHLTRAALARAIDRADSAERGARKRGGCL